MQKLTLAGIKVDSGLLEKFVHSFRTYNIDVETVADLKLMGSRNVRACVFPLTEVALKRLDSSSWFVPWRTLAYGIGEASDARRLTRWGLNALLQSRDELDVRAAVAATQSIVSRGIGKCARMPLAIPVEVHATRAVIGGMTRNLGEGGMAVNLLRNIALPQQVVLRLVLPDFGAVRLPASPRWYSGSLVGLQFEPFARRNVIKDWLRQHSLLGK
ncbi:MAG: PilZ domain-containing protein [Acidobacteria bacterium]|nr:PilZ domain-containing protein [Acidobacteriota bacterium]